MNNLGDMFDYVVYDCDYKLSDFFSYFLVSGIADAFGKGNPKYISGLSGPELASAVFMKTKGNHLDKTPSENIDKSAEYWAGWILAYYQWYTSRSFSELQDYGITTDYLLHLYPTLHEADITKFIEIANNLINKRKEDNITKLKKIRTAAGISQRDLAEASGVSIRMIQLYEQKNRDINKAQATTLEKIARTLGCGIKDLME